MAAAVPLGPPGGDAIRAVGRVVFTVELFGLVGGLVALDGLLRRVRSGAALAGLVLGLGMAEQLPTASLPSFEVGPWRDRVDALRSQMTPGTVAYVDLPLGRPYWEGQLTAMWAGMEAGVPVVNGYSGRYPPVYPGNGERTMTEEELADWMHGFPVQRINDPVSPRGER